MKPMHYSTVFWRLIFGAVFFATGLVGAGFMGIGSNVAQATPSNNNELRIIALAPHLVELLYDLEAQDQIIATSTFADFPEEAKAIPRVGDHSRLQIEKIIQLQPDLILAWQGGSPADDLDRLKTYGLKIEYSNPKQLTDVAFELRWLAKLLGKQASGDKLADEYLTRLTALKNKYAQKQKVSTFFEVWSNPLQTVSGNAWPNQQMSVCGAQNIFPDLPQDYPSVSLEQVLTNMPSIIIQPKSKSRPQHTGFEWNKYDFIPAVINKFVIHPDSDKVYRMTRRMMDELEVLCAKIDGARQANSQSK